MAKCNFLTAYFYMDGYFSLLRGQWYIGISAEYWKLVAYILNKKKKKKGLEDYTYHLFFYQTEIAGTLKSKQRHDRDSNILTFL